MRGSGTINCISSDEKDELLRKCARTDKEIQSGLFADTLVLTSP